MITLITLFVAGPIVVFLLGFSLYRRARLVQGQDAEEYWSARSPGYGRFWLALIVAISCHVVLVIGFLKVNPYASPFCLESKPRFNPTFSDRSR